MLKSTRKVVFSISALILALMPVVSYSSTSDNTNYVVITHINTKIKTVSISRLQGIFGLKIKAWDDSTPITVYTTTPLKKDHQNFCKYILGIFSHQLQRSWDRLVYSGRANSPTIVSSFDEMINAIANTPGAIGYIPKSRINSMVREVEINGESE